MGRILGQVRRDGASPVEPPTRGADAPGLGPAPAARILARYWNLSAPHSSEDCTALSGLDLLRAMCPWVSRIVAWGGVLVPPVDAPAHRPRMIRQALVEHQVREHHYVTGVELNVNRGREQRLEHFRHDSQHARRDPIVLNHPQLV